VLGKSEKFDNMMAPADTTTPESEAATDDKK